MRSATGRLEDQKRQAIETHSRQSAEFASAYAELAADPYRDCFAYSRLRLEAALRRYLPERGEGLRLLDVGCGTGHHLASLRARGYDAAGMDGSEAMLEHARLNSPGADLRVGDVERLPFPDAQFDVAICIEVLRYLERPDACLAEIRRVLRPGGVCLATAVPLFNLNGYWLVNRIAPRLPIKSLVRLKQHFVTGKGLRKALERGGFADVRIHGVYLGPINWVERLAPPLLPSFLRAWEKADAALADRPLLRELSNMFLVRGVVRSQR